MNVVKNAGKRRAKKRFSQEQSSQQNSAKKKILFVAMQNSPHACRWINSIAATDYELHLFAIDNNPPLPA
ncbi:MAG: hypothetical protein AAFP09_18845, partial [Cyanobacteria bacterium J06607_10]